MQNVKTYFFKAWFEYQVMIGTLLKREKLKETKRRH